MNTRKNFSQKKIVNLNKSYTSSTPTLKNGVPKKKIVIFGDNPSTQRRYNFTNYYDKGFDEIVSAFQQAIEITLRENVIEISTASNYCKNGFKQLTNYLKIYRVAFYRDIYLSDINLELIENYIQHLKKSFPNGKSAKSIYDSTKAIFYKMQLMGWLERFDFPRNPFPNSNQKSKGQLPYSTSERNRLIYALKDDINLILNKDEPLSGYELVICLLAIASRSGMNTTPLLEMTLDSIQKHPIKEDRKLLVLYKRRGNSTHIQNLRHTKKVKNQQTILADVVVIVEHIIKVNRLYREEIASNLVFIFKSEFCRLKGQINTISKSNLTVIINKWVANKNLKDDSGQPLKVNITRFRKTFINRIWELSGGDPFVTATLGNHNINVSVSHYLEAPKEAMKNFHFMGKARTQELLNTDVTIENNTPLSKCSRPPEIKENENNSYCFDYLKCVRCRNMVVTKEDLYRLYSFYWLLIYQRKDAGAKKWKKYYSHIIRIIDFEIAPQFNKEYVRTIKSKAKVKPHPAWKHRRQLETVV